MLRSTDVTSSGSGGALSGTTLTLTGLEDISASGAGQIKFPAVENNSANPNTIDDYNEGTWTPTFTCTSVGDLSVAYTTQLGQYTKIGNVVTLVCNLVFTPTFTTASGNLRVTGIPYAPVTTNGVAVGPLQWNGITKATYTQIVAQVLNATIIQFFASGSGATSVATAMTDIATGVAVTLRFNLQYFAAT